MTLLAGESVEFTLHPYAAGASGTLGSVENPGVDEVLALVESALADPECEHVVVRAINTIRA